MNICCILWHTYIGDNDPRWPIFTCKRCGDQSHWINIYSIDGRNERKYDPEYRWSPVEKDIPGYVNNWYEQ